jgi:hypothetical protein
MIENLAQSRICVEKPLLAEENAMKVISEKSNSKQHFTKLVSGFFGQKIWPRYNKNRNMNVITVSFVTTSTKSIDWTPIEALKNMKNIDGKHMVIDVDYEKSVRSLTHSEAVKKVVRDKIEPYVGIRFKFTQNIGDFAGVRISFDPDGGTWSLIGTDCLKSGDASTLNFAWLDVGTIMHEFGHVLGLTHEHSAKQKIAWNDSKLYDWAKQTQKWDSSTTYSNIIEKYSIDQTNGVVYDPNSIMLYFYPESLTADNTSVNENQTLSDNDKYYLTKVYPGSEVEQDKQDKQDKIQANQYSVMSTGKSIKFNWKTLLCIAIIITLLVLVCVIVSYVINRPSTLPDNYTNWKKTNGILTSPVLNSGSYVPYIPA